MLRHLESSALSRSASIWRMRDNFQRDLQWTAGYSMLLTAFCDVVMTSRCPNVKSAAASTDRLNALSMRTG
ncbi:hypothetical protein ACM41_14950 [Bradyrhizobium sp. CCBAU 21362]|nr:hypothetical protein [Bradyrhizobium sp. CCBAU 21362]